MPGEDTEEGEEKEEERAEETGVVTVLDVLSVAGDEGVLLALRSEMGVDESEATWREEKFLEEEFSRSSSAVSVSPFIPDSSAVAELKLLVLVLEFILLLLLLILLELTSLSCFFWFLFRSSSMSEL